MNQVDFQNPLYLHPSDGPSSLTVPEKLVGAQNFRSWKRSVEIALSTKRKTGFITGSVVRLVDDALERRFALSNGSRKYKLNKDTYAIEQQGLSMSEYYTRMKCVWEELDSMNVLPRFTNVTPEVTLFLAAMNQQKEEQHLFQFLNGLDNKYGAIRSQILLLTPLPSVEMACSMLQQEESQREAFTGIETIALYSKFAS
ncbi:uncharacterized protein [Rutidosis leptorrhynchoides]|uniref:uncharacterized protein n=1 Tax=Rutidosis leptorrhynchoides TaxID=125765 RepID=UPI003A99CEF2